MTMTTSYPPTHEDKKAQKLIERIILNKAEKKPPQRTAEQLVGDRRVDKV
jgi:hypothetical protein